MKPIPGFPDYTITKDGRVWTKPRRGSGCNLIGKWLEPLKQRGYLYFTLWKNNKGYRVGIHRLLLLTYVNPCPKGMECRHLDGNPANNRLDNLKWGTRKENMQDAIKHGTHNCLHRNRRGENNGRNKMTDVKVKVMRYLRDIAKFSIRDLMWQFDIGRTTVKDICSGKTWRHLLSNGEI